MRGAASKTGVLWGAVSLVIPGPGIAVVRLAWAAATEASGRARRRGRPRRGGGLRGDGGSGRPARPDHGVRRRPLLAAAGHGPRVLGAVSLVSDAGGGEHRLRRAVRRTWQQAYVNLVRWIIEPHRMSPDRWVTLREVYRSTLDPERIERKIAEVEALVEPPGSPSTRSCAPASSRASASSSRSSTCPTSPRRSARRSRQGSKPASRLARGPADAAVFAGRRRAPAPAARPGDRRGQGPRLEHARGDRPRLGNRPSQNETSTLYRRGGAARQGSGVPLRSGTRSGTTPEMSGLDREHAGVSGYGASRVGRSAHVGQESQGHLVRVAALR